MAKEETLQIDLEIEEINDKNGVKKVIIIPYKQFNNDVALRIYDNNAHVFYASTRLNQIVKTSEGYEVDVTGIDIDLLNKQYDIKEVVSKKIVCKGKVIDKKIPNKIAIKKDE